MHIAHNDAATPHCRHNRKRLINWLSRLRCISAVRKQKDSFSSTWYVRFTSDLVTLTFSIFHHHQDESNTLLLLLPTLLSVAITSARIRVRRTSIEQNNICRQSSHYHNIYVSMKLTVHVRVQRFCSIFRACFVFASHFNGILRSKWYRTPNTEHYTAPANYHIFNIRIYVDSLWFLFEFTCHMQNVYTH